MTDTETRVTADEVKEALRPVRQLVERLPDNTHTEQARKMIDALKDHAMKSVESV